MSILPPISAIRVFEAAARLANFSRAAEELGMTQAGVSYQIRQLEQRLGISLFKRAGRGIELTPMGRRIAPDVLDAFATLRQAFARVRSEDEAVLSISAPRTFATQILAARLGAFQVARPGIAVRLDVRDEIVDLNAGEFDLAIRGVLKAPEGVVRHPLMQQHITPMASPAFLAQSPIASIADLLKAPMISRADDWWKLWFAAAGLPDFELAHNATMFDSQIMDSAAALAGQGVAILNPLLFRDQVRNGQLVQLFPVSACDPRDFWLCYPEHKRHLTKVRAFRDWLLNETEPMRASSTL